MEILDRFDWWFSHYQLYCHLAQPLMFDNIPPLMHCVELLIHCTQSFRLIWTHVFALYSTFYAKILLFFFSLNIWQKQIETNIQLNWFVTEKHKIIHTTKTCDVLNMRNVKVIEYYFIFHFKLLATHHPVNCGRTLCHWDSCITSGNTNTHDNLISMEMSKQTF